MVESMAIFHIFSIVRGRDKITWCTQMRTIVDKVDRQHKMSYILNVKPKGNSKLFGHVREYERKQGFCHYACRSKVIGGESEKRRVRT